VARWPSTYKFTVPAKDFWSVVAYDAQTAGWILNQPKVGIDSNTKCLQANDDGSVDIYFGTKAPDGMESNLGADFRRREVLPPVQVLRSGASGF
jgi:hypothetical protein